MWVLSEDTSQLFPGIYIFFDGQYLSVALETQKLPKGIQTLNRNVFFCIERIFFFKSQNI